MARKKFIKTKYPGVYRSEQDLGSYRVTGSVEHAKTGKTLAFDRTIEAKSVIEANEERQRLLAELAETRAARPRKRLSEYAASWLANKAPELTPATRYLYGQLLLNHILPKLGEYYLDAITREDLLTWRREQQGAPDTINGRWRVLKTLVRDAVHDEDLPKDPTQKIEALKTKRTAKSLSAEEMRTLLDHAKTTEPKWYPFFFLLATTGLRFGEATALQWSDLDEANAVIHVTRSQWKGQLGTTKSNEDRFPPLRPELLEVLNEHRYAQRKRMVKRLQRQRVPDIQAALDKAGDWMFPSRQPGKLMHSTAPAKPLAACLEAAGITKRFTVHGFRHTFNNLLRQSTKDSVVVRSILGHASEAMTERYSNVDRQEQQKAVGAVLQLIAGGKQ